MNTQYGQLGSGYGIDWPWTTAKDVTFETGLAPTTAETIYVGGSTAAPASGWTWAPGAAPKPGRSGTSAEDWAKLGLGVGAATGGIGQLIASLKGGGVVVQAPAATPPPPTAAPTNTGLVILGVGAVAVLGLLGLAIASRPAGR